MNRKELACRLGGVDHLLQIGRGEGHGLLADDVLAGGQSLESQGLVLVVGDGNGDEIHGGIRQKLLQGGVGVDAAGLGQLTLGGLDIVNAHQIDDVAVLEKFAVPAAHAAVSDDCCVLLCHDEIPFFHENRCGSREYTRGRLYYTTNAAKMQGLLRIFAKNFDLFGSPSCNFARFVLQ